MTSPTPTSPPPLTGIKVIELAGLAPGPFCGLLLSSYGASVLRIDRPPLPNAIPDTSPDPLTAHKSSLILNLKSPTSKSLLLRLLSQSDVLIDPFRPNVLESLGLAPSLLLSQNPRLIIVRITGFRRTGKYATMAGHDINYLAVSGVLSLLGTHPHPPVAPGNILADFAGGGLVAFAGVLMALLSRAMTGRGQVVNSNMADGVAFLGTYPRLLRETPLWNDQRGSNALDGGAPYYGCYETKDHGFMSVGALEPQFFTLLLKGLELTEAQCVPVKGMARVDKRAWNYMRAVFERRFKERTVREWERVFDGTDACVVPVFGFGDLKERNYEFKPMVELMGSGGGEVVDEWIGKGLRAGTRGDERLKEWMGWEMGKDYVLDETGVAGVVEKAKL